jgi:hypothetical protein
VIGHLAVAERIVLGRTAETSRALSPGDALGAQAQTLAQRAAMRPTMR